MIELSLAQLKQVSEGLGFDAIGATSADPFSELTEPLEAYAARGRTGFEYEDIAVRIDPKQWLPEAKSIIAVAMAYLTAEGKQVARRHPVQQLVGSVSVYSYGRDYHTVMAERLNQLQLRLEQKLGRRIRAKVAVDTSPLVDRRVAERAGIGWVGKNCLVYTLQHGSFVFLGALLVDVEVEGATTELLSHCGDCSRCLQACPTGALQAPGVIDATRCLSYLTQMKGMVPVTYRKALGRRVWGCDTCQWACPENRNVNPSEHEEYLPLGELSYPQLLDVLQLSNREFQRRYGSSAAAWRGVRTWQRNALIALGNAQKSSAIPAILPFLKHQRWELRASAAWALSNFPTAEAVAALREAAQQETDANVLAEMQWGIADSTLHESEGTSDGDSKTYSAPEQPSHEGDSDRTG